MEKKEIIERNESLTKKTGHYGNKMLVVVYTYTQRMRYGVEEM